MAAGNVKRNILLIAQTSVALRASVELTATGKVTVKAASTIKEAMTAIPQLKPTLLVVECGSVHTGHIIAAKQLAELSASRKVPIVIVGGPLDAATAASRPNLGVVAVVDGEWDTEAVMAAVGPVFEEMDQKVREKQAVEDARMAKVNKQQQIRDRLAQAAAKLKPPPNYEMERTGPERKPFDAQALPQDDEL